MHVLNELLSEKAIFISLTFAMEVLLGSTYLGRVGLIIWSEPCAVVITYSTTESPTIS